MWQPQMHLSTCACECASVCVSQVCVCVRNYQHCSSVKAIRFDSASVHLNKRKLQPLKTEAFKKSPSGTHISSRMKKVATEILTEF